MVSVAPCSCASQGSAIKFIEQQQLMQFLMGLTDMYQVVRSNIMMLKPLPSVAQASSIILQEEQHRELRGHITHYNEIDSTAFLSQNKQQTFPHNKSHSFYHPQQAFP